MSSSGQTILLILAVAVAFLAFGLLCTPENLVRLEILEKSLHSESELIRRGARVEIAVARTVAFVAAAGLFLLALLWPRIECSARYHAFMGRKRESLRQHRLFRGKVLTPSMATMMAAIGLMFLWIVTADSFLTRAQLRFVHREDGILQTASALFLLGAAVISVRIALRLGRSRPEFYMHLFLG
ncbi:MAG: hypothetical protein OEM24_14850, partial [Paracoccaceae bacterium]|nr:hypothetical protein [Paracoccaceae bacterium]